MYFFVWIPLESHFLGCFPRPNSFSKFLCQFASEKMTKELTKNVKLKRQRRYLAQVAPQSATIFLINFKPDLVDGSPLSSPSGTHQIIQSLQKRGNSIENLSSKKAIKGDCQQKRGTHNVTLGKLIESSHID